MIVVVLSDYEFGVINQEYLDISDYTRRFKRSIAILLNTGSHENLLRFRDMIYYEFTDVQAYDVLVIEGKIRLIKVVTSEF